MRYFEIIALRVIEGVSEDGRNGSKFHLNRQLGSSNIFRRVHHPKRVYNLGDVHRLRASTPHRSLLSSPTCLPERGWPHPVSLLATAHA
ncbi:hypothetical protein PoB_003184300 [Plakobranchus ocellatus]|uniref:Uncharacterized protein n=1 Tax=Plakobranchus ocellatus TaxID=259542 RepID=A0AAV4AFL0_9GAST|nr:hypothetical protein PoB_003184300 [Plakobranchus ocellatus]